MSFHKLFRYHNPSVWLGACGCPAATKKLQQAHILRAVLLLNIRSKAHICMRAVVFFRKYPRRCARHTWIGKVATERHAISEPFSVQFWASPWCFCRPDHPLSIINGMLCGNMDICIYVRWLCYMRWRVSYFAHIFLNIATTRRKWWRIKWWMRKLWDFASCFEWENRVWRIDSKMVCRCVGLWMNDDNALCRLICGGK